MGTDNDGRTTTMEPVVIARAPLSISLGEAGTCQPEQSDGPLKLVIRAAISYYTYTIVAGGVGEGVQIIWAGCPAVRSCNRATDAAIAGDLALPEAVARQFNVPDGLKIFLVPQMPAGGGLGFSGSVAVSMIKALAYWSGIDLGPGDVAALACSAAAELLERPSVRVDLYAAAYGGLTLTEIRGRHATCESLSLTPPARRLLEKSLMLFRPGEEGKPVPSSAAWPPGPPSEGQSGEARGAQPEGELRADEVALRLRSALEQGDISAFGGLLHRLWVAERCASGGEPGGFVDRCYRSARECGALGGRCGLAGDDGTLVLSCHQTHQPDVTSALRALGLVRWPLRLAPAGAEILEAVPRAPSYVMSSPSLLWPAGS